jgi:hypothetical protein
MRTLSDLVRDTQPFPADIIKQVPPRNEDYVPWYHYAQRLLLHHGAHRYEVTHVVHGDNKWAVSVRLWFGEDEWYDGVGFDADADHAESQAYKRAAAHAGIGLHLYDSGFWLHGRLSKLLAEPSE